MNITPSQTIQKSDQIKSMFSSIAKRYDLGNTVLSMGIHHLWRNKMLKLVAKEPGEIALDLCTGTGDLLPGLAQHFTKVIGADFCQPMLDIAKQKVTHPNVTLVQADALNLEFADNSFDLVTVAFGVRNFADLDRGLSEIYRVLKPNGRLIVLEFGQPTIPVFGSIYKWYSKNIMPIIGGLVTGNKSAYVYLPETAKNFPCAENFNAELSKQKFLVEKYRTLSLGIAYIYQARK